MFQLFFFLAVFIVSIIILIIFLVPQWEKVTDMLNGMMDWATSLFQKKEQSKKNTGIQKSHPPSVVADSAPKKKLAFWKQIQRVSPYKKSVALILCLPGFLGIGGLQRLYVRSWFTGIIYLLTGGLFGIGTVADIVMILTNHFRDGNNLYLESEARRRWDSKHAKYRYVYWTAAQGRYFVDATSIRQDGELVDCTYLVELNRPGKIPLERMRLDTAAYVLNYVTFQKKGMAAGVMVNKFEVLDAKGNVIFNDEESSPWEPVEKDSMYECVYLAIQNS